MLTDIKELLNMNVQVACSLTVCLREKIVCCVALTDVAFLLQIAIKINE